MRLHRVVNVEDFRQRARRRLPRAVFDYVDGGADGEVTLRRNVADWNEVTFQPRQGVRLPRVDTTATVVGARLEAPFLLAPIGYTRLLHPDTEVGVARAAREGGVGYVLTTFSGSRVEDVAAAAGVTWYQLYLAGGRDVVEPALARAWNAGCRVLAVTIDTNAPGNRERDLRNRAAQLIGPGILSKLPFLPELITHPRWLTGFLRDYPAVMAYPNIVRPDGSVARATDVRAMLADSVIDWSDLAWIRKAWPGAIVMKGVLSGDDARRAVDEGAAGIIVSNHGGRQLDSSPSTASALPDVVRAVSGQIEVLADGGIRRGADIVKALCLGARGVLVGRAYAYAFAAAGSRGVAHLIKILRADVERTMRLLGCQSTSELDGRFIGRLPRRFLDL
jgi:L-lactate dehydrogenase (cytochrome)